MNQTSRFRADIQGLRALAVVSVFVYHLWPSLLPGGFVGVDVFFVISGYLITLGLLKMVEADGQVSLRRFYYRRILRLVPAASVVLIFCIAVVPFIPSVNWASTANEIVASALYFQNWWLIFNSVDYLTSESSPSILLHFWSLSVEEQFYFLWPILIALSVFWGNRFGDFKRVLIISISLVLFFSFSYSVYLSIENPAVAYFSTFTRVWELAVGALLAIFYNLGYLRSFYSNHCFVNFCSFFGLALIIGAMFFIDGDMVFPGYVALAPIFGSFLVLAAGVSRKSFFNRYMGNRLLSFFGDISYPLYLWHWPIISIYVYKVDDSISIENGVLVFFAAVTLSVLTKRFIEDPVRFGRGMFRNIHGNPFGLAVGMMFLISIGGFYVLNSAYSVAADDAASSSAFRGGGEGSGYAGLSPSPHAARNDNPAVYKDGCHVNQTREEASPCIYGDEDGELDIVLVGDSHAAQWVPPIKLLSEQYGFKLTTHTKSACAFNATTVAIRSARYVSCEKWNENVMQALREEPPDLIITSQSAGHKAFGASDRDESLELLTDGLVLRWRELQQLGVSVVVIRDTPWMANDVPECLTSSDRSIADCSTRRGDAFKDDSQLAAVERVDDVLMYDLSNLICDKNICPVARGNMLLWRDRHHLTATYARSLSGVFLPDLRSFSLSSRSDDSGAGGG
jgi:peptidoglycan/LPS O-acetylase OafA/YrhL